MDDRLVDLEVRYSYMERSVADLDTVVLELRAEVERLKKQLKALEQSIAGDPDESPNVDRPPHY